MPKQWRERKKGRVRGERGKEGKRMRGRERKKERDYKSVPYQSSQKKKRMWAAGGLMEDEEYNKQLKSMHNIQEWSWPR